MKRVIRVSVGCLLLMSSFVNASAQDKINSKQAKQSILYSAGVDGAIATGSLRDTYRYSLGGSVAVDVPIASDLYVTGLAGFQNFFYRNNGKGQTSLNNLQLLPVKAGLKYFPVSIFYVQAEAGATFLLNKSTTNPDRSAAFIYAPQVGVQFPVVKNNWIDAGVRYEHSSQFQSGEDDSKVSFLGLRVAYTFTLRGRK